MNAKKEPSTVRKNSRRLIGILSLFGAASACGGVQSSPADPPTEKAEPSTEGAETTEPAPEPLPPVVQTRVFEGPGNLTVTVLDLEGGDAIIQVDGVPSELRGKAYRYTLKKNGSTLRYQTPWHGRTLNTLVRRNEWGRNPTWRAYVLDGHQNGHRVTYSDKETSKVDVDAVLATHQSHIADGSAAAFAAFDRAAEQVEEERALARDVARTEKECEHSLSVKIVWDTVSQQQLIDKSISNYCGTLLSGMRSVCRFDSGKKFVKNHIESARCRFDGEHELTEDEGTVIWAIGFEAVNLADKARDALEAQETSSGIPLGDAILTDRTTVCTDKTGEYVFAMGPQEAPHRGMAYGKGKKLSYIPVPPHLSEGWFFDPRQPNNTRNKNFRGYDMRLYSRVQADKKEGICELTCGSRKIPMKLLTGDAKKEALKDVDYQPNPHTREPYALASDSYGNYYYVDRGNTEETKRDFRLYRGKKGALKPLKMTDLTSDSEGEIFASESGELRLVLGNKRTPESRPRKAEWIRGRRTTELTALPVHENYPLIYNELGVYLGERLGVPCDDL